MFAASKLSGFAAPLIHDALNSYLLSGTPWLLAGWLSHFGSPEDGHFRCHALLHARGPWAAPPGSATKYELSVGDTPGMHPNGHQLS